MEALTQADVRFLLALNASEESYFVDVRRDLNAWGVGETNAVGLLQELIRAGWILLCEKTLDGFTDFTMAESLITAAAWDACSTSSVILYLTEAGYAQWEVDDWGISTKRARQLMFSNPGTGTTRVPGARI